MAQLKSGLTLNEGENLVMELEAEFFAGSSNPIAQFIGNVQKLILKILGTRLKGYLVITDQRVVEVYSYVRCYIFNVSKTVKCLHFQRQQDGKMSASVEHQRGRLQKTGHLRFFLSGILPLLRCPYAAYRNSAVGL